MDGIATQCGMPFVTAGGSAGLVVSNSIYQSTIPATDFTGSDLIWVAAMGDIISGTFTDSEGNTWIEYYNAGYTGVAIRLLYCKNPTTSATQTFALAGLFQAALFVAGFSGFGTSTQDAGSTSQSLSATSRSTGSFTPGGDGALIVSACCIGVTGKTLAVNSGLTIIETQSTRRNCAIAYKVQPTAATENIGWSWDGSSIRVQVTGSSFSP